MKLPLIPLVAVATGVALGGSAQAQNAPPQRGFQYLAPGRAFNQNTAPRSSAQPSASTLPGAAAAPAQVAPRRVPQAPVAQSPVGQARVAAPYGRYPGYAAPGIWGVRYVAGNGYPVSLFGNFSQGPAYEAPGYSAGPVYDPDEVAQGTGAGTPPAPGYAAPGAGVPQAGPSNVPPSGPAAPMYGGTPSQGGISPIYGYAGRFNGPYYGYGPQYYGYGGCNGWGSGYNSPYYTAGYYGANACCRSSRRLCTPFGGMALGCGSGCYVATPPPCPTLCDPCNTSAAGPGYAPQPMIAPPASGIQPQPQPLPPTPQPPTETPPPPQPSVKPAPQASLFPRVPIYPRIPNLPET